MAYFAKLENNIVVQVISVSNDVCGEPTLTFPQTESAGRAFIANTLKFDGEWKQTSFNNNFRGIYAGIGYTYDAVADEFISPQPYPSWTRVNKTWQAPTPIPSTGGPYTWSEEDLEWVAV